MRASGSFAAPSVATRFSAAMCWAACDRLARIAARLQLGTAAATGAHSADTPCRSQLLERAWREALGQLLRHPRRRGDRRQPAAAAGAGHRRLARSALHRHPGRGRARPARRATSCCATVTRTTSARSANAFTVCSFWWANALAGHGRRRRRRARCSSRLLAVRNCVGLLSEDVDPHTGALWGTSRRPTAWSASSPPRCA